MSQREPTTIWPMLWRFALMLLMLLLVFVVPIMYIVFARAPFHPLASWADWQIDHLGLRLAVVALFIAVISGVFLVFAIREFTKNPMEDLAAFIRRIGSGDFRVRAEPYSGHEPHELTQVREALNAMAADLEHAETLRTNMMADVSHELRTPLTALEGNLRAALDRVYSLDEAEIANLYGQTRHLIRLVDDLHELALADARQLPLDRQPTAINDLLHETLALFAPLADEQAVTLQAVTAQVPMVALDSARIRQVLHNLLGNALRHTPPGGTIKVTSAVAEHAIQIAIADTGDGLEPDQLQIIFDRFYRTDKSRSRDTGGTGLGLAIVSAIIATHDGTITAASDGPGQGSTFTVKLPLANNEAMTM